MITLTALDILEEWVAAINRSDLAALQQLYRHDATLVPTFSDINRHNNTTRSEYLSHFTADDGISVQLIPESHTITEAGPLCIISGFYSWQDGSGFSPTVARFSFVIDLGLETSAGSILHHHSSVLPDD